FEVVVAPRQAARVGRAAQDGPSEPEVVEGVDQLVVGQHGHEHRAVGESATGDPTQVTDAVVAGQQEDVVVVGTSGGVDVVDEAPADLVVALRLAGDREGQDPGSRAAQGASTGVGSVVELL